MAGDVRFECRFCIKPITTSSQDGGRRIKCPHCKNLVHVPVTELWEEYDESLEFDDLELPQPPSQKKSKKIPQQINRMQVSSKSKVDKTRHTKKRTHSSLDATMKRPKQIVSQASKRTKKVKKTRAIEPTLELPLQSSDKQTVETKSKKTSKRRKQSIEPTLELTQQSSGKQTSEIKKSERRKKAIEPTLELPLQSSEWEAKKVKTSKRRKRAIEPTLELTQQSSEQKNLQRETSKRKKKKKGIETTLEFPQQISSKHTKSMPMQEKRHSKRRAKASLESCAKQKTPQVEVVPMDEVEQTPLKSRRKWFWLLLLLKLFLLAALIYASFFAYKLYLQQNKKTITELFVEHQETTHKNPLIPMLNGYLIHSRISKKDFSTIEIFSQTSTIRTRILVAQCLETLALSKGFKILSGYLQEDIEPGVRVAAAAAFENIREIRTIELLIEHLKIEVDPDVKGRVAKSLRGLTGETGKSVNFDYWRYWWKLNKRDFEFIEEE